MGKIFTLLTTLLFFYFGSFAAAPTASSSNLNVYNQDGSTFNFNFTAPSSGGGARRIVVMKAGSAIDFTDPANLPDNGVDYNQSTTFGTAGTAFKATGGFVVYDGTAGAGTTISGLSPHTTYHLAIFEYNGTGAAIEYRMVPCIGSGSTVTYPTVQSSNINFTQVSGNQMLVSFTKGNGNKTLVIVRKGANPTASPSDLTNYNGNGAIGSPSYLIAPGEYVVFHSTSSSFWLTNLEPNTTYHLAFFEANGSNTPMYLKPAVFVTRTTNAGPTTKPGNPTYSAQAGNRFTLNFTNSDASKYLVVARQGAAPTFVPTNGTTVYTGSTVFGSGTQVAPGEYVISNAAINGIILTNLLPGTTYHIKVYGYDTDATGFNYYQTTLVGLSNGSTVSTPPDQASITGATILSGTSLRLNFTQPAGATHNLILAKAGSPVNADPVDLVTYNQNSTFGSGSQIGTGNYVIYDNSAFNNYIFYGLTPGTTYHFAIYAYNGASAPLYKRPGNTFSFTMPNEPTAPATAMTFSNVEGNSMIVSWTSGTGANRIIIARKGSPVTAVPVDNTAYTADRIFGSGTQIAPDEFVVYNGSNTNFSITNLEIGATYHYAVFEYNGTGASSDYRTSTFLTGNRATQAAPTTQVSAINATAILENRVTLSYTRGNGSGRLFVMKANTPVTNTPANLTYYNSQSSFGSTSTSSYRIGTDEYVVEKSTGTANFSVTNLTPSTTYHVAAFEYNGSNEPVYLTSPVATYSFTTTASTSTPVPTTASSVPTFNSIEGNSFQFNWTAGNGSNRIVVAKAGSAPQGLPVTGTSYAENNTFGTPAAAFTPPTATAGEYVVYRGNASVVTVNGLQPNTTYHFVVYEYNGSGATSTYLTSASLSASRSTAVTPASGSTTANVTIPTSTSMRIGWTNGAGANRLVVVKQGSAVTGTPADLMDYASSTTFGSGSQFNLGEYVVYKSSANNVTITGLTSGQTYHYRIFDFNGSAAPVYNTANTLSGSVVLTPLPLTWGSFTGKKTANGVELTWTTISEVNTSHFEIERSTNAIDYTIIGAITAKGQTTENIYRFTDNNVSGTGYYRIKQVDKDDKSSYSRVVSIQMNSDRTKVTLYPNPASHQVYVQVSGQAIVQFYDANGRRIIVYSLAQSGFVDIRSLQSGIYTVEVLDQKGIYKTQLLKQ